MPDVHCDVLLSGWSAAEGDALAEALRLRGVTARAFATDAFPHTAADRSIVAAFGPELAPTATASILQDLPRSWVLVALGVGDRLDLFQELVEENRIFFLARRPPRHDEIVEIVVAAWTRTKGTRKRAPEIDLSADLPKIATGADRAVVWRYDDRDDSLVSGTRHESAAAGLTSYVARTGRSVVVDHLSDDPRYDPDLDNAGGDPRERFMASPIILGGHTVGVLSVVRPPVASPFEEFDQGRLESVARLLAGRQVKAQLFRGEALDEYQRGSEDEAHLLEIEPRWARYAYRVVLALFSAALLFSALARVDREAQGAGVIRDGRLVAVVPARYKSEMRSALPLRFDRFAQPLTVGAVDRKVIAATEARRLLGPDGAALWASPEPALRIDTPLGAAATDYGNGVAGRVRVRLGRERALFVLVPALRGLHD
jgi:GAF domain-containing protein